MLHPVPHHPSSIEKGSFISLADSCHWFPNLGLSKTALRNLPKKALSSENVQFIAAADDSLR
jgi:hypothetical protein